VIYVNLLSVASLRGCGRRLSRTVWTAEAAGSKVSVVSLQKTKCRICCCTALSATPAA